MNSTLIKVAKVSLPAAFTLSMMAACSPTNTPTTTGTPSSSPSASVSSPAATPTPAAATPTPAAATPTPTAATPTPAATPTASASASTSPTATPSASATTNASATSDISVVEKTTLNGKVYDDTNAPLDGVTIRAKSLNSSVPFDATGTTSGGSYAFNNAPSGVQIEIQATRAGYTTRRRVEVLKSNKTGDPNANRYDFGNDGGTTTFGVAYNALSDKPEVSVVTPGRNASGIDPKTSFVLKFSEPMDKATVQDNFEVYAFNNKKFTVDTSAAAQTVSGPGDVNLLTGTRIWDKAAFTISWNSDDTEATFTFKEERLLPTDRDSAKTPDYQVGLNRQDGAIKDKSGISRGTAEKKFKLTDGDFERSYKFSIKTDEKKPTVDSLVAQTAENSGANSDGDAIKVRFSERMIHYTLGPTIAGGMGGVISQAAGANNTLLGTQVAPNYKVTVIRQAATQMNQVTWGALGGSAIFDTNDPTHKTVILLPPTQASNSSTVVAPPASGQQQSSGMTFLLSDGTTATAAPASAITTGRYFRNTGSGTAGTGAVARGAGGAQTAAADAVTIDFFYTDGSSEPGVPVAGGVALNETAAGLTTKLDALMTAAAWTVTDSTPGDPLGAAAVDTVNLTLSATAQRGGKNVSIAIIRGVGAFAAGKLGAGFPADFSGYVVAPNANESLSSAYKAGGPTLAGDTATVDFFYTDGTSEAGVVTTALNGGLANATAANVQTALNALVVGTGFNVASSPLSTGDTAALDANERYFVGLASGTTRFGKTIALARLNSTTGAFAAGKLNSGTGWVLPSEYAQVQYDLNNHLLSTGGLFTVTETPAVAAGKTANVFNAGDVVTLTLGANPKSAAVGNPSILQVFIPQGGTAANGFGTAALNAPAAGFTVYPGTTVGSKPDLYKPGDNVIVKVDTTVLDPAGNSVDSSSDNASANAS